MRHHYHIYGLRIGSNRELPALRPAKSGGEQCDIAVCLGKFPDAIRHLCSRPSDLYYLEPGYQQHDRPHLIVDTLANGDYFHFRYEGGVEFILDRAATAVWGKWEPPLTVDDAALYLQGPIIGFALRLRGVTCLHASGVVVDGQAVAIAGPSGAGKSTLAAAFAAAGHAVLSDDVIPLIEVDQTIHAISGYGRLRLYPNAYEYLESLPDELPQLTPNWDKRYLDLADGPFRFHSGSAPLKAIYLLDWGAGEPHEISFTRIAPAVAVPLLAANTYRNELLDAAMRREEFLFLSRLAAGVRVNRVSPVDDISSVPGMCEMILNDVLEQCGKERCPAGAINEIMEKSV